MNYKADNIREYLAIEFGHYYARLVVSDVFQNKATGEIAVRPALYLSNRLESSMKSGQFTLFEQESQRLIPLVNNAKPNVDNSQSLSEPLVLVGGDALYHSFRSVEYYIKEEDQKIEQHHLNLLEKEYSILLSHLENEIYKNKCFHATLLNYALYRYKDDPSPICFDDYLQLDYSISNYYKITANYLLHFIDENFKRNANQALTNAELNEHKAVYIPNIFAAMSLIDDNDAKNGAVILELGTTQLTIIYVKNNRIFLNATQKKAGFKEIVKDINKRLALGEPDIFENSCKKNGFYYFKNNLREGGDGPVVLTWASGYTEKRTASEVTQAIRESYLRYAKGNMDKIFSALKERLRPYHCEVSGSETVYLMGGGFNVEGIVDLFKEGAGDYCYKQVNLINEGTEPLESNYDTIMGVMIYQYKKSLKKQKTEIKKNTSLYQEMKKTLGRLFFGKKR